MDRWGKKTKKTDGWGRDRTTRGGWEGKINVDVLHPEQQQDDEEEDKKIYYAMQMLTCFSEV